VRIRTAILLAISLLVAGVMVAVVVSLSNLIDRGARAQLATDLERGRQIFEELQGYRQSLFRAEIRVVAEEPRLKAVAATEDVSHATVLGVAQELRRAVASELFLITDGAGRLLADVADPTASGGDLSSLPLVAEALRRGEAEGVLTDEHAAYQVQARRLTFGTTTVGVLVIGHRIDDRVALTVRRQTGSGVIIGLDGTIIAASGLEHRRPELAGILASPPGVHEVPVRGEPHLAVAATFPGYLGERRLRYAVLHSLQGALDLRRGLVDVIYLSAAAALAVTVILAILLGRRVARPVDALVAFTRRVGAGELDAQAPRARIVEIDDLGVAMNRMVGELQRSRNQLAHQERLERELEIAQRMQTSILPPKLEVAGLSLAAAMRPASEVGGDYYDVLTVEDGGWIGIGDVAGHGLSAGIVMLMVQSLVAALVRERPGARPSEHVVRVNEVLHDNIRHRLGNDEHVTFTLLRYRRDGRLTFAGAHEEIVICRAATGRCELIPTPGTWLGAVPSIADFTPDSEARLEKDDVMLLYTDGVIEAMDAGDKPFGIERLCAIVEENRSLAVEAIRDRVMDAVAAWTPRQVDDVTLLVIRYHGE